MIRTLCVVCTLIGGAAAQDQTRPCEGGVYDDFDFWIGVWDVETPDGQVAGRNVISPEEDHCLIIERWTGAAGGSGQSYNFYDPGLEKWRQVWVSGAFTIDYAGGLDAEGAMALEGEISYRNGRVAPFRGVWTLREDGTVRQHFEEFNEGENAWKPWFTGIYRRAASTAAPE